MASVVLPVDNVPRADVMQQTPHFSFAGTVTTAERVLRTKFTKAVRPRFVLSLGHVATSTALCF